MEAERSIGRIVIAGGSGFLGVSLARHLSGRGAEVVILSRHPPPGPIPWTYLPWDARTVGPWARSLDGAGGLVNLAGRSVDCIKTPDHCDEILRSRVEATRALGLALRSVDRPPRVWVQIGTAHMYGDPPTTPCDEDSATGFGLAPDVGRAWEQAFHSSLPEGMRAVVFRTSFVIGRNNTLARGGHSQWGGGGALARLRTLARLGLGGRVASGRQGMSWIHERDMNRLFERALLHPAMSGTYNATSPNPVGQVEFMRDLRRVAGGLGALGIAPPAPAWLVRLGAPLLMRTDAELAIYGRYVLPARLLAEGFTFSHPTLSGALSDLAAGVPADDVSARAVTSTR